MIAVVWGELIIISLCINMERSIEINFEISLVHRLKLCGHRPFARNTFSNVGLLANHKYQIIAQVINKT